MNKKCPGVLILCFVALMLGAVKGYGIPIPLYGVQLSGVLTTQVNTSSTTSKLTTQVVSNATIIKALTSGTGAAVGIPKRDLALVVTGGFDPGSKLTVINTGSNNALVATIATEGTNDPVETDVDAFSKTGSVRAIGTQIDLEFTLPGVTQVLETAASFTATQNTNTGALKSLSLMFLGGWGSENDGAMQFRGSFHLTGKKY